MNTDLFDKNKETNYLDSFDSNSERFPTSNTITSQNSGEGIQYINESQLTQQNAMNSAKPQSNVQLSAAPTVDSSSSYIQHNTLSLTKVVFF